MKIQPIPSNKKPACHSLQSLFFANILDFPDKMSEQERLNAETQIIEAENKAKQICNNCVLKKPCLEFAVRTQQEFGIWGATTPLERRRIKRWGTNGLDAWNTGQRRKRKTKPNTETHQQQTRHHQPQ